ncbi:MAG: tripartite tricarboxylate transporter substrate binding protein [Betaproteobacteria bacterium]|nr:tripartite tricarboxylate transporter substrate binding protein [Betaproteobacteria bacterium]
MRRNLALLTACLAVCAAAWAPGSAISAQAYPARPLRLVVPFAPGGGNDIVARAIALRLTEALGQPVVVDNRGGAGGIIGTDTVAKAQPDGYTIGMGSTSALAINPALFKKLPFDPVRDFAPITLVASAPYILSVHPSVPAKSVKEFIALAKAKPETLHFSSAGNGATNHLAGEIFKTATGIDMVHVPYKGAGPAMFDAIAGQVQLTFGPMVSTLPHVRSRKLRGLGVSSAKRSSVAPELPTIAESGVPGYEVVNWYGMVAPASTPRTIVDRLNREIVRIIRSKELKERLTSEGAEVIANAPDAFAAFIKSELGKWGKAVRDAKVTLD